jgi:hypothetical protein
MTRYPFHGIENDAVNGLLCGFVTGRIRSHRAAGRYAQGAAALIEV